MSGKNNLYSCGPIDDNYVFPTSEIQLMQENVINTIHSNSTSIMFYGRQRIGKTVAKRKTIEKLKLEDNVLVLAAEMLPDASSPRAFIEDLYDQFNISKTEKRASTQRLYSNLVQTLISKAEEYNGQIVLFIDEAQRLSSKDLDRISYIYNKISDAGSSLTTILIGNMDLYNLAKVLENTNQDYLYYRFCNQKVHFTGIDKEDKMRQFLKSYDVINVNPLDKTSPTFTELYFSEAYKKGKRLEDETELLYRLLAEASAVNKIPEILLIDIVTIVEYIFKTYGSYGMKKDWITEKEWRDGIYHSDIASSILRSANKGSIN